MCHCYADRWIAGGLWWHTPGSAGSRFGGSGNNHLSISSVWRSFPYCDPDIASADADCEPQPKCTIWT
jgi:hypothetical protein